MLPKHTQEAFKRKQGWEEWQDIIADVNYILLGAQIMQSRYFYGYDNLIMHYTLHKSY